MEFEGKVAVITGAGMGMGKAIAIAFAEEGASIVVVDVNIDTGQETVKTIQNKGGRAIFIQADVSNASDAQQIAVDTISSFERIDVLVNNAGIQHYGSVIETTEEEWDQVLGVNLKSIFLCSKYCIPEIQKQGSGSVINIASVQGIASQKRVCPYSASKGGAISLTRNMAIDFAADNIRVNCVCPGSIDTPLLRAAAELTGNSQQAIQEWADAHVLKRVGQPEEVAQVVLFLASNKASFITGAAYVVDGGLITQL